MNAEDENNKRVKALLGIVETKLEGFFREHRCIKLDFVRRDDIPVTALGVRYDIEWRVLGRPGYLNHLTSVWADYETGSLHFDWNDDKFKTYVKTDQVESLMDSILRDPEVQSSVIQLKGSFTGEDKQGVVRRKMNILSADDFLVNISDAEFARIQDAYANNSDDLFTINVVENPKLKTRFIAALVGSYQFLDVEGLAIRIETIKRNQEHRSLEITGHAYETW